MASLSAFSLLSASSWIIIEQIDALMISQFLNLEKTGIFTITMYFGLLIVLPTRSLYGAAHALVAQFWKDNEKAKLQKMYRKSCEIMGLFGLLLFLLIWGNIDNILQLLPPSYAEGRYVILFFCLGGVVEMFTGLNGIILVSSKFYKYDTVFVFLLIFITILLNYLLIPRFGIVGVAMANFSARTLINLFRFLFLWYKFNFQPYTINSLKMPVIATLVWLAVNWLPHLSAWLWPPFPLEDIACRSLLMVVGFGGLVLLTKVIDIKNISFRELLRFNSN
ncbi:MAG: hypothetical protein HC896_06535 [Bacteroidales bacterium]|nr:hypothetical protein [Bacteroidales bacterium]